MSHASTTGPLRDALRQRVWEMHCAGQSYNQIATFEKISKSTVQYIVKAVISSGRLCVRRCPCTLTAESYQAILQSALQFLRRRHATGQCPIASKCRYFPCSHPPCQFQQDGAPAHCAKSTRLWMQKKKVVQFNAGVWPPVSPDLSPIEHVWPIALRHLNRAVFSGKDQLWSALQQAFAQITPAEIAALYQSMPQRLAAVVAAGGGPTRY